jgi:hypothetical protein
VWRDGRHGCCGLVVCCAGDIVDRWAVGHGRAMAVGDMRERGKRRAVMRA